MYFGTVLALQPNRSYLTPLVLPYKATLFIPNFLQYTAVQTNRARIVSMINMPALLQTYHYNGVNEIKNNNNQSISPLSRILYRN